MDRLSQYTDSRKQAKEKRLKKEQETQAQAAKQAKIQKEAPKEDQEAFNNFSSLLDPENFLGQFYQTAIVQILSDETFEQDDFFRGSGLFYEETDTTRQWLVVFRTTIKEHASGSSLENYSLDRYACIIGIAVYVNAKGWFIANFTTSEDEYLQAPKGIRFTSKKHDNSPSMTIEINPPTLEQLQDTFIALANEHLARLCPEIYGHLAPKPQQETKDKSLFHELGRLFRGSSH